MDLERWTNRVVGTVAETIRTATTERGISGAKQAALIDSYLSEYEGTQQLAAPPLLTSLGGAILRYYLEQVADGVVDASIQTLGNWMRWTDHTIDYTKDTVSTLREIADIIDMGLWANSNPGSFQAGSFRVAEYMIPDNLANISAWTSNYLRSIFPRPIVASPMPINNNTGVEPWMVSTNERGYSIQPHEWARFNRRVKSNADLRQYLASSATVQAEYRALVTAWESWRVKCHPATGPETPPIVGKTDRPLPCTYAEWSGIAPYHAYDVIDGKRVNLTRRGLMLSARRFRSALRSYVEAFDAGNNINRTDSNRPGEGRNAVGVQPDIIP